MTQHDYNTDDCNVTPAQLSDVEGIGFGYTEESDDE